MLEFILGRAGSGKTKYVRRFISEKLNNGENNLLLLVPEQFSFESEKMILESVGPSKMTGIDILSFSRLANSVIEKTPYSSLPRIDDGGRAVILRLALDSLGENIKIYRKFKTNFNGLSSLLTFIQEMKQCAVTPNELNEKSAVTSGILSEKLKELSLICEAYDSFMSKDYFDDYNLISVANEQMAKDGFFVGKTVILDAFTGYTAQEMKIVDTILKQAENVCITLCTDSFDAYNKYSPFAFINATAKRIVYLAKKNNVEIKTTLLKNTDKSRFTGDLEHLEKNLYSPSPEEYKGTENNISIIKCESKLDECKATALEIKRLMREEGVRCRQIAVFERSADTYDRLLEFLFKKYDIPFFEDNRMPIGRNPLVMAIRYALKIAALGNNTDRMLSILKTGMTSLSDEDVSLLENYCFVWGIKSSEWKNEWVKSPDGFKSELSEDDSQALLKLNELRSTVNDWISTFLLNFRHGSGKGKSEAIYKLLFNTGADKKLYELAKFLQDKGESAVALEQERVWNALMQILNNLAVITGENEVSPKLYYELFEIFISGATIGNVPQGLDDVAVADAQRSRLSSPDYLFVLGLNEGEFPRDNPKNGIISEGERRILIESGLEILPACDGRFAEERYIAYHALTSASKKLYLIYNSGSSENGTDSPSEVIENVKNIFPSVVERSSIDYNDFSSIESEQCAFSSLAANWNKDTYLANQLKAYFEQKEKYQGILSSMKRVSTRNKRETSIKDKNTADRLYKKDLYLSASKIETYHKCPFWYFCRYGLNVAPLRKAEIDAAFSGTIIHHCLEVLIKEYGRGISELSPVRRRNEIRRILEDYAKENMDSNKGQTAKFLYNFNYHVDIISRLVDKLVKEFEFSSFTPVEFEMPIREDADIQPYEIESSDGGKAIITGFIDRVDLFEKDSKSYVRIVDYKSGSISFSKDDLKFGLNCQMFIYLFALWKNGGKKFPNFVPSGVLYFKARDNYSNVDFTMSEEEKQSAVKKNNKMDGIVLDDNDIILAMDKNDSGDYIPASTGDKDSALSLEEFEKFRKMIETSVSRMVKKLHEGDTSIYPTKNGNYKLVCDKCDYKSVCGFESNDSKRTDAYEEVAEIENRVE